MTGKHRKGEAPLKGTRFDGNEMYLKRYWHDPYFEAVSELERIAKEGGIGMVQLAFAWLLRQKQAHCIIVGASRLDQLEQNLAALETEALSPQQLAACDRVWRKLRGPTPFYNR